MSQNFEKKYIKYKLKYLYLKTQIGGAALASRDKDYETFKNEIEKILNVPKILDIEMLEQIKRLPNYDKYIDVYMEHLKATLQYGKEVYLYEDKLSLYEDLTDIVFPYITLSFINLVISFLNPEDTLNPDIGASIGESIKTKMNIIILVPGDSGSKYVAIDQLFQSNLNLAREYNVHYLRFPLSKIQDWPKDKLHQYLDSIIAAYLKTLDPNKEIIFGMVDIVSKGRTVEILVDYLKLLQTKDTRIVKSIDDYFTKYFGLIKGPYLTTGADIVDHNAEKIGARCVPTLKSSREVVEFSRLNCNLYILIGWYNNKPYFD